MSEDISLVELLCMYIYSVSLLSKLYLEGANARVSQCSSNAQSFSPGQ